MADKTLRERAAELELLADVAAEIGYFGAEQVLRERAKEFRLEAGQIDAVFSGWRGPKIRA